MSPLDNFRAALAKAGIKYGGAFITDGNLHRFMADGDRDNNSWYVLHAGPPSAGAFGCWKRDVKDTWCERGEQLSQAECDRVRQQWQDADQARKKTEAEQQIRAAETAAGIIACAKPVTAHEYLTAKSAKVFGDLREFRGELVLPLRDTCGELHSLQFIGADGEKKFLSGGKIAGCCFILADKPDGPLAICEGYATGASIHATTGFAVVCAMNCGNLLAVSKALREKYPARQIIICSDNDQFTTNNPGLTKAMEAAKTISGNLAVPQFTDVGTKPTDYNDLHQLEGINAVRNQIENATPPKETDDELFQRLAKLTPVEYDHVREDAAKKINIRVSTLDTEVTKRRPKDATVTTELKPWDEPVNGAELLDKLAAEFEKFIVLPAHAAVVLALWVLHTYLWEVCEYSPIVAITSPVRSCGKSRVLDVLERLASKPFRTGNMSEAVLFRVLDDRKPSVLIDEFDTIPEERRDALANILKHGFHRSGRVHRVEGDATKKIVEFAVFGPKALACIKLSTLDSATVSRCINIRMQRKRSAQKVARLRRYDGTQWQRQCLRWAADNRSRIETATVVLPESLGDREQDIWEPLFVLANHAGGSWPDLTLAAALALCGESADGAQDTAVLLLGWIQKYFASTGREKTSSSSLAEWLNKNEDAPYSAWKEGKGITQNDIRRLMAGFEIRPETVRIGVITAKGYALNWFDDAFASYLPEEPSAASNTVTTPVNIDDHTVLTPVTADACYQPELRQNPNENEVCYSVTPDNVNSAPVAEWTADADLL